MRRAVLIKEAAKALAYNREWRFKNKLLIGNLRQLKQDVLETLNVDNEYYYDEYYEFTNDEKKQLKEVAEKNNLKTYQDWSDYNFELSNNIFFKSYNSLINFIIGNDYFKGMSNKEILKKFF